MQSGLVSSVSTLLAVLTIVAQVGILVVAFSLLLVPRVIGKLDVFKKLRKNGRLVAFFFALAATVGSLFYSDVAGYEPCKLCWYQRIFMYPQVILLAIAIVRNDKAVNKYIFALSGLGAVIAAYHYVLQRTKIEILPCSAVGYSASCSNTFIMQFGYITIPLMALTAFVGIVFFLFLHSRRSDT